VRASANGSSCLPATRALAAAGRFEKHDVRMQDRIDTQLAGRIRAPGRGQGQQRAGGVEDTQPHARRGRESPGQERARQVAAVAERLLPLLGDGHCRQLG
jgi:hypothetical protein